MKIITHLPGLRYLDRAIIAWKEDPKKASATAVYRGAEAVALLASSATMLGVLESSYVMFFKNKPIVSLFGALVLDKECKTYAYTDSLWLIVNSSVVCWYMANAISIVASEFMQKDEDRKDNKNFQIPQYKRLRGFFMSRS